VAITGEEMQIIENRALHLRVRDPSKITSVIPCSERVGDHEVLVRWGLEEAQVLKNLNIRNVPSPIRKAYKWPGPHKPFVHQITTAEFLTLRRRAFCFNEQGLGKTASAIWAADYLMNTRKIRRVLVVCPVSIMGSAWQGDLFRFAMHRTFEIAHSSRQGKRKQVVRGNAEFVIINYDGLEIVVDDIIEDGRFDLIIVDEANYVKNVQTDRWKSLNKIIKPHTWVWLMTGTPASQEPSDAYGLAKIVNPKGVPPFFGQFRDKVMTNITRFKWVPKPDATETVFNALQPAIRFTKEECLDLPDVLHVTRDIPLTKQQGKYYDALLKQQLVVAAGEEISAPTAAAILNKLLQISGGAVYTDNRDVVEFDCTPRLNALRDVITEASHKVLVFVPYTHSLTMVSEWLKKQKYTVEVVNGAIPPNKRTEIFNRFQTTPDPRILVIQPQAASHGVTLHAANVVVYWSPVMSVETYLQANARVHRAGQVNKVTVVHLQGSRVEGKMYRMLQSKVDIHQRLVDLYKEELDVIGEIDE
jgi:SNF2 family DNA or RNA helicase